MAPQGTLKRLVRTLRKALRLLARPAHGVRGAGGVVLQPYRGYGSRRELFLIGRVYHEPRSRRRGGGGDLAKASADLVRLLRRRGLADAKLRVRFHGTTQELATDKDGYFRVHLHLTEPPPADRRWHGLRLELLTPTPLHVDAAVFIPPDTCRVVVISDIDDTVMKTGVANRLVMLWRLFGQGADRRLPFPGMAAFLRALYEGGSGAELNPMLYVSRAPWGIYEVLDAFFRLHAIPVGPLLYLREWGLTLQSPLPRRAKDHKLDLIRHMLALYDDLPFVLIGDSGQHDPELYARVVRENPGRVRAVYIRNVSRDPARLAAIEALAAEVAAAGSTLLLTADTQAMADHAARHGLIAPAAVAEVRGERRADAAAPPAPTDTLTAATPTATRAAVQEGRLAEVLDQGDAAEPPPSVTVEPERGGTG
jgi:phosphatidate phosphatase APP1